MSDQDVASVMHLDLQRYLGLWFEIGRLPLRFEDDDAIRVTAEYSLLEDGTIRVDNRCIDGEGVPTQAIGKAEPVDEHPGRLRVTFLPAGLRWIPFTRADYWVLRIDPDYRIALVGTPDRKHLWLLARDPELDPATAADYAGTARAQGFDLSQWIRTEQTGTPVADVELRTDAPE
ncbi:hypothetical protein BMH32_04865 [Leucobacter sp. OLJS4]|uniref:lipocalin family protein n=1 Tax=unclassified Leucobacter TaxID=2621730 RepID=UPI000C183331|nr:MULTISPECIES: lipocalin family protein [unclassified Leucobacter]PIJ16269.1 hypothetical protein BMH30_12890 [Leucobacter sp. OLES1]PII81533.1 hypothetical protein BMH25_13455 [Leucobacter sp. OLCALW19]PII86205.1 hypothetical protein BMH26_13875 [Leucobacter sp. OLTLW20]PII90100.1 hypothetical protein BMH27_12040 [Leucobacter sp. OLAS13]PII97133.1 hypothetical protein BMH29_12725 [Leucobacter sp. OLDS2]